MQFTIERIRENGFSVIRLSDTKSGTFADILPDHGAMLHQFSITLNGEPFNVIDNYADEQQMSNGLSSSYKSSKLSPFPCRIPNGKYKFKGKDFEFENKFADGSAIHGLLYNKPFNISNEFADETRASVTLRYAYNNDDKGYPYKYNCEVRYTLHGENALQLETTLTNLDDSEIPIADGWHPYFQLGNKVDECILQFNSASMLEFDSKLIPTGKLIDEPSFYTAHRLGDRQIDNCFLLEIDESKASCQFYNPNNKLLLSIFSAKEYAYLQIYTPPHRNSIAIENLSAAPDCFNNGMGLILLRPGNSQTFNTSYKVDVQ